MELCVYERAERHFPHRTIKLIENETMEMENRSGTNEKKKKHEKRRHENRKWITTDGTTTSFDRIASVCVCVLCCFFSLHNSPRFLYSLTHLVIILR